MLAQQALTRSGWQNSYGGRLIYNDAKCWKTSAAVGDPTDPYSYRYHTCTVDQVGWGYVTGRVDLTRSGTTFKPF